jgi:hypothetical protein
MRTYGQYCPIARAAEFLLRTWPTTYLAVANLPDRRVVVRFDLADRPAGERAIWLVVLPTNAVAVPAEEDSAGLRVIGLLLGVPPRTVAGWGQDPRWPSGRPAGAVVQGWEQRSADQAGVGGQHAGASATSTGPDVRPPYGGVCLRAVAQTSAAHHLILWPEPGCP